MALKLAFKKKIKLFLLSKQSYIKQKPIQNKKTKRMYVYIILKSYQLITLLYLLDILNI